MFDVLVSRARGGDYDALGQMVVALEPALRETLKIPQQFQDQLSTEDVMQAAYIRVLQKFSTFTGTTEASFAAWVHTIAKNTLRQATRALATLMRGGNAVKVTLDARTGSASLLTVLARESSTPSRIAMKKEDARNLSTHMAKLAAIHQDILRARFIDGHNITEIAKSLEISDGAAAMRLHRALVALRLLLRTAPRGESKG